jgi:disulfide bond formation protein DsbB
MMPGRTMIDTSCGSRNDHDAIPRCIGAVAALPRGWRESLISSLRTGLVDVVWQSRYLRKARLTMSSQPLNDRIADSSVAVWAAMLSALVASLGSLWLTIGMDLEAGPLCLCQRTCVLVAVGILAVGLLMRDQIAGRVGAMAMPIAVAALGIGGIQVFLEYTGKLECPKGIMDVGSAPQQAVVAEAILLLFLLLSARTRAAAAFTSIVMGAVVAWLLFATSPKLEVPTKAYNPGKLTKCRVPFVESTPKPAKSP